MKFLTMFLFSTLFLFSCSNEQKNNQVQKTNTTENNTPISTKKDTSKLVQIEKKQKNEELNLPFVGKRYFNFLRGTGTGYSIEIKINGDCIIQGLPGPEPMNRDQKPYNVYHGKFSELKGYKFVGNEIYCLEKDGSISKDCLGPNTLCVSDLTPM
jgi:hypothetical protein